MHVAKPDKKRAGGDPVQAAPVVAGHAVLWAVGTTHDDVLKALLHWRGVG